MNIITGYRAEPHITSAQDRAKNQGAFGVGSYILDVGRMLETEIISANEVRIRDGVLSHQGCVANIESGAYDTVEISNGSQGMQRIDLIVARYTKDAETNIEDIQIEVIEGTPAASNPTAPAYNDGDIQDGDSPVDMPLYRVNISGITISSCTLVAQKIKTQAEADAAIDALNSYTSTSIATGTHLGSSITFEKIGRVCTMRLRTLLNIPAGTTETTIGTIPLGYVPVYDVQQIFVDSGKNVYRLTLQSNGNISVYSYNTSDIATVNARVVVAYMTE